MLTTLHVFVEVTSQKFIPHMYATITEQNTFLVFIFPLVY